MKPRLLVLALMMSLVIITQAKYSPDPEDNADPEDAKDTDESEDLKDIDAETDTEDADPKYKDLEDKDLQETDLKYKVLQETDLEDTKDIDESEDEETEDIDAEETDPEDIKYTDDDLKGADPEPTAQTNSTQEEESVSDTITRVNKNIESRLHEGDIVVDRRRNAVSCFLCKWPKSGSKVYVRYRLDPSYSSSQKSLIRSAMRTIESRTCVRFQEISRFWSHIRHHLYIHSGSGCWSYIGRKWWTRKQKLSLSKNGCLRTGTIQHELLHALGFAHEHSRSDRDAHVRVLNENIQPDQRHNFNKHRTNNLYTPYDFNSVMQYSNYAWSTNGRPTLLSRTNPSLHFGHSTGVSYYDILRVRRYYRC